MILRVLGSVTVLAVLAGCGSDPDSSAGPSDRSSSPATSTATSPSTPASPEEPSSTTATPAPVVRPDSICTVSAEDMSAALDLELEFRDEGDGTCAFDTEGAASSVAFNENVASVPPLDVLARSYQQLYGDAKVLDDLARPAVMGVGTVRGTLGGGGAVDWGDGVTGVVVLQNEGWSEAEVRRVTLAALTFAAGRS